MIGVNIYIMGSHFAPRNLTSLEGLDIDYQAFVHLSLTDRYYLPASYPDGLDFRVTVDTPVALNPQNPRRSAPRHSPTRSRKRGLTQSGSRWRSSPPCRGRTVCSNGRPNETTPATSRTESIHDQRPDRKELTRKHRDELCSTR